MAEEAGSDCLTFTFVPLLSKLYFWPSPWAAASLPLLPFISFIATYMELLFWLIMRWWGRFAVSGEIRCPALAPLSSYFLMAIPLTELTLEELPPIMGPFIDNDSWCALWLPASPFGWFLVCFLSSACDPRRVFFCLLFCPLDGMSTFLAAICLKFISMCLVLVGRLKVGSCLSGSFSTLKMLSCCLGLIELHFKIINI